jgi:ATP-binding cassette, subfamily B, bacterial PglK
MADTIPSTSLAVTRDNILVLFSCLSWRRKVQVGLLLIMQTISAFLDILSIGAIIPFLHALTDTASLLQNPYILILKDMLGVSDPNDMVAVLGILFGAGIIIANIFRFLTLSLQQFLVALIGIDLGRDLYHRILHKPYTYFIYHNTSETIGHLLNDLNRTLGVLTNVFTLTTQMLIVLTIVVGLFIYNPSITLAIGGIVAAAYLFIL